jgi:uncharacterized repeat protein (TIGR03803 family)
MIRIRRISGAALCAGGLALAVLVPVHVAHAGKHKVLYSFTGGDDGGTPFYSTLVMDKAGNLYGTTVFGGEHGAGTVFKLSPNGDEVPLYNFTGGDDGAEPSAGLVRDKQGNFYGTTYLGGENEAGTVFKLAKDGTQSVLHHFGDEDNDGVQPLSSLVFDDKQNLYGTTYGGGEHNAGTVFKITRDGDYSVPHSFGPGGDGTQPIGDLIVYDKKTLYGTTQTGGAHAAGSVFRITSKGKERVIYSFEPGDGTTPYSGLVKDEDGNMYGVAASGGAHAAGAVYKVTPDGTQTVLYSFGPGDGAQPISGLLLSEDGNLYGTCYSGGALGAGAVFRITLAGKQTVLHSFGPGEGAQPRGRLIEDKQFLYGTIETGGAHGAGTVFKVKK